MRSYYLPVCCLCLSIFLSCNDSGSKTPNILFIAIDDLRPDLGAYGNPLIKSPNLDQLAKDGFLFNHHYVQVPTCGASRYALLTGLYPRSRAALGNNIFEKTTAVEEEQEIPESFIHQLRRSGYYTVGIGKISHSADGLVYGYNDPVSDKRELSQSWDQIFFNAGKWKTGWNAFFAYANGENRQSLKKQVKPYEKAEVLDDGYPDGLSTKIAIEQLGVLKDRKQPFFLGLGLFKPHLPFTAPQKYWDLYDPEAIAIAENPRLPKNINLKSLHSSGEFNQYALGEEKAGLDTILSDAYAKKLKHAYYACVSYVDHQVGLVLEELKNLGLDKNTIVVVWGDHGWHLGEQQVWGKHSLFENALRSAFIMKVPQLEGKAKNVNAIVESIDIYPTLMELCNLEVDHPLDGQSLLPIMNKEEAAAHESLAFGYYKNGITLRTERYRLTKYYRTEEPTIELYDHQNDPLESVNIASEHSDKVEELLILLKKGDTGLYQR